MASITVEMTHTASEFITENDAALQFAQDATALAESKPEWKRGAAYTAATVIEGREVLAHVNFLLDGNYRCLIALDGEAKMMDQDGKECQTCRKCRRALTSTDRLCNAEIAPRGAGFVCDQCVLANPDWLDDCSRQINAQFKKPGRRNDMQMLMKAIVAKMEKHPTWKAKMQKRRRT